MIWIGVLYWSIGGLFAKLLSDYLNPKVKIEREPMNNISRKHKRAALVCIGIAAFAIAVSLLSGCGRYREPIQGPKGDTGQNGAQGIQGNVGSNGSNGTNGLNALFGTPSEAPLSSCPNSGGDSHGGYGQVFTMGLDANGDGILENNEIQQVAIVCNGQNGTQGLPGVAGSVGATGSTGATGAQGIQGAPGVSPEYSPVAVIEPCGHSSSNYKEVLIGLEGGYILSEFSGNSSALTVRNTLLPDGSYQDTDDSFCSFTVSTDSHGNRTVSWVAQTDANGYVATAGSITYTASTSQWSGSN